MGIVLICLPLDLPISGGELGLEHLLEHLLGIIGIGIVYHLTDGSPGHLSADLVGHFLTLDLRNFPVDWLGDRLGLPESCMLYSWGTLSSQFAVPNI